MSHPGSAANLSRPPEEVAFAGVGVTTATPFSRDGRRVDLRGLDANVRALVQAGVRLIYPCGNTGEFAALDLDEWTAVLEATIAAADGATVVAGVGGALPTALEMAARARYLGADGILLMPLTTPYVSEFGTISYYEKVARASGIPSVLYLRGSGLRIAGLRQVVTTANCHGIKFALDDVTELIRARDMLPPHITWICGRAETWAPFCALAGTTSFTSGLANFAPSVALSLAKALDRRDYPAATELAASAADFEYIRTREDDRYNVAAVKYAMSLIGLAGGRVRAPLSTLTTATKREIRSAIQPLTR